MHLQITQPQTANNIHISSWAIALFLLLQGPQSALAAPLYRPEQIRREINTDEYQLIVQKDGQLDLRRIDGSPILDNALPTVRFADGKQRKLDVDYRRSERTAIRNPLGQGNGFLFQGRDVEWRVATYPTQPFLTFDLTFINHTRKPVQVARVSPLGILEGKGAVHLGPMRDGIRMLIPPGEAGDYARILPESEAAPGHLGAYNTGTGQVLVAGFLTQQARPGTVQLTDSDESPDAFFDRFACEAIFDPPVTVEPGERLQADTLYLAITERDPQEALERFAQAARRLATGDSEESADSDTQPVLPVARSLFDWGLTSRSYYLSPAGAIQRDGTMQALTRDTAGFSDHQFITAWTLAALQGALRDPDPDAGGLSPLRQHILAHLLPAPTASARPLDLFQEGPPQRWVLPLKTAAGDWTIVALFNWDTAGAAELDTPLTALGLNNENYYTVYDFWASQYLGLIEKQLHAEVPPEGVRLFGLRRYEKRPMLVASNRHFSQGASDHTALDWSYETRVLSGSFDARAATAYTFTVFIPEPYTFKAIETTAALTAQSLDGTTLTFTIQTDTPGPTTWRVNCGYAP